MFFLICPENYQHPNGQGKTVAYYLFDAEAWDPNRDIYEQGYVIEVWELKNGRTEFYVIDGNVENSYPTFTEALIALKDIAAGGGMEFEDDTDESLKVEYDAFLESESLPEYSVEDLLHEPSILPHQRRVLSQFLLRWNAMEELASSEDDRHMDAPAPKGDAQ
ncbi:hypothetical protein [Erythrobacter aureus]|uniref:Uncharacterized protein n=1 Tax=Erythrobacter aureus TaxID=2182384 RepID=A0A345YIQ1_9SPHN|nr:hypothetical protein [Erythrobacter aureus]AXK43803.1 hypothetical protein DVR09_15210 [Erythrobacter aureus]